MLALRLAIGFHFYKEGVAKLNDPKPFSAMFFGAAKGPASSLFQGLVWDADGHQRFDHEATTTAWSRYVQNAKRHFRFDDDQAQRADDRLELRSAELKAYLDSLADELDQYEKGLERRESNRRDPARRDVPSLRGQAEKTDAKLKAERGGWLAELDKLALDLQRDINHGVATPEQLAARGELRVEKPGRRLLDSESMDQFIPYFDVALGVLLMLGLFTRAAAMLGAGFLLSVVVSQWPGAYGAQPTYYQAIEMLALVCLCACNAGRCGGLDSLLAALRLRCCPPKNVS